MKGIVGHEVDTAPLLLRDGPLVASGRVATWLSLGSRLAVDHLVVMGDGLISRRSPVASLDSLHGAIEDAVDRRGRRRLREAHALMRPGTDSAPETRLRLLLTRAGLPEPEVNGLVVTEHRSFHGDLVFRDARVVVEYDGAHHRLDEAQYAIDVDRLDHMMEANWRVVRVDKRLMANRAELVRRVRVAVESGTR